MMASITLNTLTKAIVAPEFRPGSARVATRLTLSCLASVVAAADCPEAIAAGVSPTSGTPTTRKERAPVTLSRSMIPKVLAANLAGSADGEAVPLAEQTVVTGIEQNTSLPPPQMT